MHVSKDSMWWRILKNFVKFSGTKLDLTNQSPQFREPTGRPRLLGFSSAASLLDLLSLMPRLLGFSSVALLLDLLGTSPLRRLPCLLGGGFSSADSSPQLFSPTPIFNLPYQSQRNESPKCSSCQWLVSFAYPSEEQGSKKFTASFRAWRAIFLIWKKTHIHHIR